jgi:hypothetical protein
MHRCVSTHTSDTLKRCDRINSYGCTGAAKRSAITTSTSTTANKVICAVCGGGADKWRNIKLRRGHRSGVQGRPGTRSFGQSTDGLSSGNAGYPLSDGAFIFLTTVVFADRTGTRYGQEIVPDTVVSEAREAAATWLLEQPACRPE